MERRDEDGESDEEAWKRCQTRPSLFSSHKVDGERGDASDKRKEYARDDPTEHSLSADVVELGTDESTKALVEETPCLDCDVIEDDGIWMGSVQWAVEDGEEAGGDIELVGGVGGEKGLFGAEVKEGEGRRVVGFWIPV